MSKLLPVGAYVLVRDPGCHRLDRWTGLPSEEYLIEPREFYAVITGYDLGRTKYQIGERFGGWGEWMFMKGGSWTFPLWCTEVTEEETRRLPERESA